jgi:putative acetyltransferase
MKPAVAIRVDVVMESPRQLEVIRFVESLDAYLAALYPPECNHRLDIDALSAPEIRFFVARFEGKAVGCGALRIDLAGYGELKRMYVDPMARGRKVARAILLRIEEQARVARLSCVRLEAGVHQPEALGLYHAAGYREISAFGDYGPDPMSVFMEKVL